MRIDRHRPCLCARCQAPMRSRAGACWRCGAEPDSEDERPAPLPLPTARSAMPDRKAA